jgi:flavin reductase (DIM6/NTAB) family NADH-FMN oxidoreductase RutF
MMTITDPGVSLDSEPLDLTEVLSPERFKLAFRNLAAGVSVVTADDGTGPVAMTATSVISISATPPLLVFSASQLSSATPVIENSDTVVVHVLTADQIDLAKLCSASGADRFADTSLWKRFSTGEPYFPGASAWIRGRVVNRMTAGSSTVHVVEALDASADPDDPTSVSSAAPLVYHNRTWHALGEHSALS